MSGFSSFKESKLLFEGWRKHLNEALSDKEQEVVAAVNVLDDEGKRKVLGMFKDPEGNPMTLQEDGHTDVASAMRKMSIACESAQELLEMLSQMPQEDDLPSWWMSKATLAADYITKMRNYLVHPTEEEEQTPLVGEKKIQFQMK